MSSPPQDEVAYRQKVSLELITDGTWLRIYDADYARHGVLASAATPTVTTSSQQPQQYMGESVATSGVEATADSVDFRHVEHQPIAISVTRHAS